MKIIVEYGLMKQAKRDLIDIAIKNEDNIVRYNQSKLEIEFKNGDILRFVRNKFECLAGLYADVAWGEHSYYLTAKSKHPKRMWDGVDFYNYLKEVLK